jgi:integrase
MAKRIKLTAKRVEALLKKPGRYRDNGDEGGVRGLLLVVVNKVNASWQLRYERNGRERWLGLGPARLITLKQARDRARVARVQLLDGVDPLEQKQAKKAAGLLAASKVLTFQNASTEFFNQNEKKWRNAKARAQFLSSLKQYAFPVIGKMSVADIDTGAVLKVLEQKHTDHPKQSIWVAIPSTANRVRRRIENVLDWATVRGYRSGENPARWKGHLSNVLPAPGSGEIQKHHAALPYVELPAFLVRLRQKEGVAARALEFTILTAARTGEVTSAVWSEINFSTKTWTVPPGRMKGAKEHRVPLSDRAIEILQTAYHEEGNDHIFVSGKGGLSNMGMAAVLLRMGRADVTVHGFRSTFMDWAHERSSFAKVVIDMSLAHAVGDKVEAAYRRGDLIEKRRQLMSAWATYCASKPTKTGEVIPLREANP